MSTQEKILMRNIHPVLLDQINNKVMCNYRINLFFTGPYSDYWKNFHKCRDHYQIIAEIFNVLKQNGVEHRWFFFEPYVEITWLDHVDYGQDTLQKVVDLVKEKGFTERTDEHRESNMMHNMTYETAQSKDGLTFCEWFDRNYIERFFGALRYKATSEVALSYYTCKEAVDAGRGPNAQFMRSIHSMANQMGLNYRQEGWCATKRGMFCLLVWLFHRVFPKKTVGGYKIACFIYEKIFRQKDVR